MSIKKPKNDPFISGFLDHLRNPEELWRQPLEDNTICYYGVTLYSLCAVLLEKRGVNLVEAQEDDLNFFMNFLMEGGLKEYTIKRKMGYVQVFYRHLLDIGEISADPSANLHKPRPSDFLPILLSRREIFSLLDAPDLDTDLGVRDAAMLEVSYALGLYRCELLGLQVDDIKIQEKKLSFMDRRGKRCLLPLHDVAVERCSRYLKVRKKFAQDPGQRTLFLQSSGKPMTPKTFRQVLLKYSKKAGLSRPATSMIIRNSLAKHMLDSGIALIYLHSIMRNKSFARTERYRRFSPPRLNPKSPPLAKAPLIKQELAEDEIHAAEEGARPRRRRRR